MTTISKTDVAMENAYQTAGDVILNGIVQTVAMSSTVNRTLCATALMMSSRVLTDVAFW